MQKYTLLLLLLPFIFMGCDNAQQKVKSPKKPKRQIEKKIAISYKLLSPKDSIQSYLKNLNEGEKTLIAKINRADFSFLNGFDSIIIPYDAGKNIQQYMPFPFELGFIAEVNKIIFFSYPAQAFAAYENGELVYTGPTNMGRKADMTPTGLFFTNWKAEETTSTFNDEWNLKWNFNIENKLGVGFHEYAMPGYPASHSCLRLSRNDAMDLYEWADQWKLEGTDNILAHGTPVIVFGSYPFGSSKPWLALAQNPDALTISEADLKNITTPYLPDILKKQAERDKIQ